MTDLPETCPVCGTALGSGRSRCPGCGSVFGEDNRCPSCHAISAVRPAGAGYVCSACGAPRERAPGTAVDKGRGPTGATAGGALGLRFFGVMGIAAGVLGATVTAVLVPGLIGVVLAAGVGGLGVGLGALSLRAAGQVRAGSEKRARLRREAAILELATARGGVLTVTDVSRALGIGLDDADRALTLMADGSRVTVEISEEGIIEYVFREVDKGVVRARVEAESGGAPTEAEEEAHEKARAASSAESET